MENFVEKEFGHNVYFGSFSFPCECIKNGVRCFYSNLGYKNDIYQCLICGITITEYDLNYGAWISI